MHPGTSILLLASKDDRVQCSPVSAWICAIPPQSNVEGTES